MPNYANGKIYKIVNNIDNEIYVGSTCLSLNERLRLHKKSSKRNNFKLYQHVKTLGGWDAFLIVLIEECPCETKTDLLTRERYYIDKLATLNKVKPRRTKKEYNEDNKEKNVEYQKQYYEYNKEKLEQYHKQYRGSNKEKIDQWAIEYYKDNKEKINEKRKQKYICECGMEGSVGNRARHERTIFHQQFIKDQNDNNL